MMIKRARLSSLGSYSVIDRDSLLFGHKKAGFIKHDISNNLIMAEEPIDIVAFLNEKENPDDWTVFRTRAIDAGGSDKTGEIFYGPNDNGDYFSEEELLAKGEDGKYAFSSFIGCPLFSNHKNDDIEQSRGKVLNAFYDLDNHCVYIDGAVDKKSYPQLARGIEENYINDTSMGASVKYSICSVCGNKAVSDRDFCFVPGTKITLSNFEIENIENIEIGDSVLTHDGTTGTVLNVFERNIDEEIYEIYVSGSNIPLEVTGNHPIFVQNKLNYRNTFNDYFKSKPFNPEWKEVKDIAIGDFLVSPKYKVKHSKKSDPSFARLAGIYFAEGSLYFRYVNGEKQIRGIDFTIGKHEQSFLEDILKLCKTVTGKEAKYYLKDHSIHIRIIDTTLAERVYNLFGEYSKQKYFGSDFFKWNKNDIKEFIGGYIDGDGYFDYDLKNRVVLYTASETIARQFQNVLSLFDSWCTFFKHENSENEYVKYINESNRDIFNISIQQNQLQKIWSPNCIKTKLFENKATKENSQHWNINDFNVVRVRKIVKKEYSGKVFNFEVEGNNSYLANNVAVHNCDHVRNHKGKTVNGKKVYEKNYGIKFIENSFVTDGACENCTIQNVYSGAELLKKINDFVCNSQQKLGNGFEELNVKTAALKKEARAEDVESLNQALDLLKKVADQILNSRDVDYDFLESIGSLLADLQDLIVDLVEAGFANAGGGGEDQSQEQNPEESNPLPTQPDQANQNPAMPQAPQAPPAQQPMQAVDTQLQTHACSCKSGNPLLKELKVLIASINKEINNKGVSNMQTNRKNASNVITEKFAKAMEMKKESVVVEDGPYSIQFHENGIEGFLEGKLVASLSAKDLGEDMFAMAKTTPQLVAGRLIQMISTKTNENGDTKMAGSMEKEALLKENTDVENITEKQLEGLRGTFERKDADVDVVTEEQLKNVPKSFSSEKGETNRRGEVVLPVGETQLKEKRDDKEVMEVFEGQLEANSLQSKFSADDNLQVTEEQLKNYVVEKDVDNVTERQLRDRRATPETVINAVLNGMSNLVVSHKISPKTIASAVITAGNIGKSAGIAKKAQYTKDEISQGIENAIAMELGEDLEDSQEFMNDALEVMFSDQNVLASEVEKSANAKINEIKLAMNKETQTVEAQKKSTIASIWSKRTASTEIIKSYDDIIKAGVGLDDPRHANDEALANAVKAMVVKEKPEYETLLSLKSFVVDKGKNANAVSVTYDQGSSNPTPEFSMAEGDNMNSDGSYLSAGVVEQLQKLAQNPNGSTLPPANPADMGGAPPVPPTGVENLGAPPATDPMAEDMDVEDDMEEGDGEAKPFGSVCPVCGSTDVDGVNGKFKCNDCDAEYQLKINWELLNTENFTDAGIEDTEGEDEETEAEDINDQINSSPAALPAPGMEQQQAGGGGGMPPMGAHSNGWLRHAALQFEMTLPASKFVPMNKTASTVKPIGSYCPQCGGQRVAMKSNTGVCTECGCKTHVDIKKKAHKLDVLMTWQPNIELAEKENTITNSRGEKVGLGYAVTANCENCDDLNQYLHQILSNRKSLEKIASATAERSPMLACMSDQMGNGYTDESAHEICASIKEYVLRKEAMKKQGLLTDDDDDEAEDELEDDVETVEEETATDDADVAEDSDFEEVEVDDDDTGEDAVEFEGEDETDEADEEAVDFDDEFEDVEELDEETGEFAPIKIDTNSISSIVLKGTDANGQEFEVEIGNPEVEVEEESFDLEPENLDEAEEAELGDVEEGVENIEEDVENLEDEVEDVEGLEEVEDDDVMKGLFSDGLPNFDEEAEEAEEEEEEDFYSDGSELLRGNRLASSASKFGMNIDLEKLAASMPLQTGVDVPTGSYSLKSKDDGATHKNTAKNNLHGNAAGTSFKDEEAFKGTERGVEVITAEMEALQKTSGIPMEKFREIVKNWEKKRFGDGVEDEQEIEMREREDPSMDFLGGPTIEDEENSRDYTEPELGRAKMNPSYKHTTIHSSIKVKKVAQNTLPDQSMPLDAVEESDVDIPRDESKAKPKIDVKRKDVLNPTEIVTKEYKKGPAGTNMHNDAVVPRDGSGDGLGGKKPKFDVEESEKATSGNPDTYVQEFKESPKPTNKLSSTEKAIKKIANMKNIEEKDLSAEELDNLIIVSNLKNGKVYKLALKK